MAVGRSAREGRALKIANFEKVRFFWRYLAAQCDKIRLSVLLI